MSGVPSQPLPPAPAGPTASAAGALPVAVPVADGTAVTVPAKLQGLSRAVAVPGMVTGTGDNGLTIVRTGAGDLTLRLSDPPPADRPVTVQLTPGQPMRAIVLATPLPAPQPGSTAATILSSAQPPTIEPPPPEARPPDTVGSAARPPVSTPLPPPTLPPTQPGAVVPAQVVAATPLASLIAGAAGLALPGSTPAVRPQSLSTPGVLARLVERLFAEYDQAYGTPSAPSDAPDAPTGKPDVPVKGAAPRATPPLPDEAAVKAPAGQGAPAEPATDVDTFPAAARQKTPPDGVRPVPADVRPVPTPAPGTAPLPGNVAQAPQPERQEPSSRATPPAPPQPTGNAIEPAPVAAEQTESPLHANTPGRPQARPVVDAKPSPPAATVVPSNGFVAPETSREAPPPARPNPAVVLAPAAPETAPESSSPPPARPGSVVAPTPTTPETVPEDASPTEAAPPTIPVAKTGSPAKPEAPAPRSPPLLTQGGTVGLRILSVTPPDTPSADAAPTPPPLPSPDGEPQITGIVGGTTQRGQPVLVTASGSLILNTRTPLEKGTVVTAALLPEGAPLPLDAAVPDPVKLMTSGTDLPETRALLAALSGVDRGIAAQVAASLLPQPNRKLGAALTFLLGAMRGGDARGWLGDEATGALGKAGLSEVVSRFEREFRASDRESADSTQTEWRSYTLPMLDSAGLNPIRLHVQAIGEEERKKRERGESERRSHFLVDLSLSRLGPLQLDGLVRAKRFDLLLRSHAPLPEGLRGELTRVFTDSVTAAGFTGGISFQTGGRAWIVPVPRAEAGKGVTA